MATNSGSQALSATISASEFRALCQFFVNVFQSGGVEKTADSGQIDWTSVNFPGSNNTMAGYEIREFTDPLQSSDPIFIKFEFGRGAAASQCLWRISTGSGSDGSGNLTGARMSSTDFRLNAANGTFSLEVSAGDNWFVMVLHTGSSNTGHVLAFERTSGPSKEATNKGCQYFYAQNSSFGRQQFVTNSGAVPASETISRLIMPGAQTSGLAGDSSVAAYPIINFGNGESVYPMTSLLGVFTADFTDGNTYTFNIRGVDQTMKKLPAVFPSGTFAGTTPTGAVATLVMRYE